MCSPSPPSPILRVQINQIDHVLAPPGPLDNSTFPLAPILRIYGPSSSGQKTCVHIHQVYPYFFIDYSGPLKARDVKLYTAKLRRSLDHAIALSFKRDPQSSKSRYVRSIVLVKGVHFYGFHSSYSPFLKVMVIDPACVSRIVTMLQAGTVMGTRFRVYESHLSYVLQFLSDFGLYGCGWIELGQVFQRCRNDEDLEEGGQSDSRESFPLSPHFRQSRMSLEVDAVAPWILNRHKLVARNLHHKLEIPAPALSEDPLVLSVRELWEDERNRRRASGMPPSPEMPLDLSESSRRPGGDWASEARWWDEIRKRIERERGADVSNSNQNWEGAVMSTFESIEVLWENEHKTWKPRRIDESQPRFEIGESTSRPGSPVPDDNVGDRHNIDVDISFLSNEDFQFESIEDENLEDGDEELLDEQGDEDRYDEDDVGSDSGSSLSQSMDNGASQDNSDLDDPFQETSTNKSPRVLSKYVEPHFEMRTDNAAKSPELSDSDESDRSITPTPSSRRRIQSEFTRQDHIQNIHATKTQTLHGMQPQSSEIGEIGKRKDFTGDRVDEHEKPPVPTKRRKVSETGDLHTTTASGAVLPPVNPGSKSATHTRPLRTFYKRPTPNANAYLYSPQAPSVSELLKTLSDFDIPNQIYRAPYYSDEKDAPPRPREYAGLVYNLKGGEGIVNLEEWKTDYDQPQIPYTFVFPEGVGGWEYSGSPPGSSEVRRWLQSRESQAKPNTKSRSQIAGPTQANIYGLKITPPGADPDKRAREKQDMTILSLEVFAPISGRLSNPDEDELVAVFYTFQTFEDERPVSYAVAVEAEPFNSQRLHGNRLELVATELELINRIVDIVIDLDPDIITGWDVQNSSWGYLASRARTFDLSIEELISRAPPRNTGGSLQWETRHTTTFKVAGRHVLNLWRIMRSEVTLNIYTFENVVFHVLGRRIPKFKSRTLTDWYCSPVPAHADTLIRYLSSRTSINLEILNRSEVVTKTAEFARVFGVDFYSVISRGSQFKVESFMFRLAKPESFVLVSPSKADVGKQNAAECLPLIMEPQSALYTSPLVVLDFQSLYPSIMIAYNYCYSTCLGRVVDFQGQNKLGVVNLKRQSGLLEQLQDYINGKEGFSSFRLLLLMLSHPVAPNGMMYVKPQVRKGLLGRMLTELLDTRVMVKQAMKRYKHDKTLTRILNARQLGLKYIANVTYGYTSASYSGRMPAVEIADSIVQSGRETLEKAITLVNETKKWGAEVVYGDTDSMFIYLKGKTREQAFQIGHQIAESVTALNPSPIKLKFEKVYHPCVLMAKKRYVGFKYESIDDAEPVFDAKGIETVRRDGVPAQQKMTENCLKILFRTQNLSEVKEYCYDSWTKLMENRASVQDFIFAKEVRMGTYSETGPPPPGVAVAAKRALLDPSDEPQYGERVPYVIARGPPGSKLVDRAMDPLHFLANPHARLDATYYISRVLIPPLERIFNLVGADVRQWYNDMPKAKEIEVASPSKHSTQIIMLDRFNIDEHFNSSQCLICRRFTINGLCVHCWRQPQTTLPGLLNRVRMHERRLVNTHKICVSCTGATLGEATQCESLDCPWLFARKKSEDKGEFLETVGEIVQELVDESALTTVC